MDYKHSLGTTPCKLRMQCNSYLFEGWHSTSVESDQFHLPSDYCSSLEVCDEVRKIKCYFFKRMLFGGNGLIYTASEDTTIGVWNKNGHRVAELKAHSHWVNTLALHTDFTLRTACFTEE